MSFQSLQNSYTCIAATPTNLRHNAYIVPVDKSFGFSSLTHASPYNSTRYFGIGDAYSNEEGACTTFAYRGCSSDQIQTTPVMYVDSIIRPKSS